MLRRSQQAEAVREQEKARQKGGRSGEDVARPEPLRVDACLKGVPWSLAQDEIGLQVTDFIAVTARMMVRARKDQRSSQLTGFT